MGEARWLWQKVSDPLWCLFAHCLAWGWIRVRLPQQAASQGHGEHSTHEQPWELGFHYLVGCHWIMGC